MAGEMTEAEIVRLCKAHSMFSWSKGNDVNPWPIERAEGIYMYGPDGQQIIDFNSQLMSVNVGHGHPKVRAAMKKQIDQLLFVWPGAATEIRARVSKMLSELVPGNLNTFFYTLGGAEANENAIKAAKLYTGRHKILARYRSYHGATNATMQLTGDPRRLANEPGMPGVVHVMDPNPYDYSFGATDEEKVARNLQYLEEVIMYEGPETIAAMFIETVTGTNGILPPPKGYLQGLRALLDKYGILLVCDEVMCGFGRTGKMFAFEHAGIVPDILTMAKGLTSSYAPMGCMAVSDPIAAHFKENVFWGGLTYNAHCLGLATAEAVIEVMQDEGLVENAQKMGVVMRQHMQAMQDKHPSVRGFRQIGLFGMMDLQRDQNGTRMAPYNGTHPGMKALGAHFRENHLFTFVRWGSFMCNPPLCINEQQLEAAFDIIDRGLDITDAAMD
ncbi:MAG: aminotransferase class III-fold pyridoxal phosphate-dependent enzyme [Bradymonadia bacterium]